MLDINGNNAVFQYISLDSRYDYLVHLNISSCGIQNISASTFALMKNLKILDLSWNYLAILSSRLFASQKKLKTLRLSNNMALLTIETEAFTGLDNIHFLNLNYLNIKRISQNAFSSLHLEYLDLSRNEIQNLDGNAFATLSAAKILLNKTTITKFSKDMFKGTEFVDLLVTDHYKFCCIKPYFLSEDKCLPRGNEISSCADLLKSEAIRPIAWAAALTAIVSNILAFIYRMIDRERLKLGYGIFVSNLAVSDFLMGVYLIIITGVDLHHRGNYIMNDSVWRNSWLCNLAGILATLSSETSVFFVCFITLDRLLVVKYPFGEWRMTERWSWVLSLVAWLIGLFVSIFPILFEPYFKGEFYSRSSVCLALPLTRYKPAGWLYSVCIFIGFNFLIFVLIAFGQWSIFREVTATSKKVTSKGKAGRKKELRVARNLLLVALIDFLCWFPVGLLGKFKLLISSSNF